MDNHIITEINSPFPSTNKVFNVVGAGELHVGPSANCCCAGRAGFFFAVSWGKHGYSGGVLSREEALKLAKHIMETLETCTDTEEECYNGGVKP